MDGDYAGADELLRIRKFEVGDLVFAKLKGYPPWPSKINQIESIVSGGKEKVRYNVYFYGTHQSSILRSTSLFHYDTYAKSIVDKWGRRPKFHEALEELEREMMAKIVYLKELRNTPDSSWSSVFDRACNGLVSDFQDIDVNSDPFKHPKKSTSKPSVVKKITASQAESVWNESRSRGYEILYMERIPFPDTPESLVIVSLSFNKDWVQEEVQRIKEEENMMNCHVSIEPFPSQYAHLLKEIQEGSEMTDLFSDVKTCDWDKGLAETDTGLSFRERFDRKSVEAPQAQYPNSAIKVQKRAAMRCKRWCGFGRTKRRTQKAELHLDSDTEMETCPVCRLCFFSSTELSDHQRIAHAMKDAPSYDEAISDAESVSDIIYDGIKPSKALNVTSANFFLNHRKGEKNPQTLYLKEGYPVDALTISDSFC